MNFDQWIKEMSKGTFFSKEDDKEVRFEKGDDQKYWDSDDDEELLDIKQDTQ